MKFDWENEPHATRHGVTRSEIEEAMAADPKVIGAARQGGESRFECLGETVAGRVIFVVVTTRGEQVRPITAYPASKKLTALYRKDA